MNATATLNTQTPQSLHIVVGGRRIHFLEWGHDQSPVVVLLHGGGLTAHTWNAVCQRLSHRYRCIGPDLRGHGDSEWSNELRYDISDYVDDLAGLLDELALSEPVVLIGMSLGGIVASYFIRENVHRVRAFVSVDVGPGGRLEEAQRMTRFFKQLQAACANAESIDELVAYAQSVAESRKPAKLRSLIESNVRVLPTGRLFWKHHARQTYNVQKIYDALVGIADFSGAITCPTLLVKGDHSRAFDTRSAERFADALPNGALVVIDDAGHVVQEDAPEALTQAIDRFLKQLDQAPRG